MQVNNTLKILFILTFILFSGRAMCSHKAKIDENVRTALRNNGKVMVLVKLKEQSLSKASLDDRVLQIEELQDSILSVLSEQDFQLHYRYKTIPGFSGILY